jgi:hypothetical protein
MNATILMHKMHSKGVFICDRELEFKKWASAATATPQVPHANPNTTK